MFINKSIVIAGLARDCQNALIHNIPKIDKLRSCFQDSSVIIVENDSKDKTKDILIKWKNQSRNIVVISEDYHSKFSHLSFGSSRQRIEKLCFFRNKYMDYLRASKISCDFLLIIDIDIDDFNVKSIVKSIVDAPSDWVALFANGVSYFKLGFKIRQRSYDYYAFLPKSIIEDNSQKIDMTLKEMIKNKAFISKQLKKNKYLECLSAFGGIGIYKFNYIRDSNYYTIANTRSSVLEVICEHIPFNLSLKNHGKKYIVKNMIVYNYKSTSLKMILLRMLPVNLYIYLYQKIKGMKFPE